MRKTEYSLAQLENLTEGKEHTKESIAAARIQLLRAIAERIRELRDMSTTKADIRNHIESYIESRYATNVKRMNYAVTRSALTDLVDLLYSRPKNDEENFEQVQARLAEAKEKIATHPVESIDELVGVYLRMKDRDSR